MRTKAQILNDTIKRIPPTGSWDNTASLHERLTIEVLIDIRDNLTAIKNVALGLHEHFEGKH